MNNKQLIIGGIIILVLGFFGVRSYQSIENQNSKYKTLETTQEKKPPKNKPRKATKSSFTGQKIFTYSSYSYDIERSNGSMITKMEKTFHTFDFNKKTVTQNSILNGKRVDITYPFKDMYEEKGALATTYVLKVNTSGVKEIW